MDKLPHVINMTVYDKHLANYGKTNEKVIPSASLCLSNLYDTEDVYFSST